MDFGSSSPLEDTSREEELRDDRTLAFTPSGEDLSSDDEELESDVDLDFTHVFGGKFEADDDLGDDDGFEEIALDEASTPEVTQPLGSTPSGRDEVSPKSGDTVRRPSDSTSPDATQILGADSGDSGQGDWPPGVTMPVGLSGSDRAESESPDTHREAETIMHDSGTLKMGSGRRSSEVHTPKSREITGLSSGRTVPRGPLGEGGASRSLKAGDVQLVGPEQIRLRAFGLNEGLELEQETDFLLRGSAGKGGMGIVYRAQQRSLDRDVAVKQMKPDLADSESDRSKFLTEAVITGQLEHPNIIPVHELGLAADGLPFYAMKFVIGDDWEDRIKKLSEQENLSILIQVANAIAFAHSRSVIHRDLKPGNVRLGNFGEVLVMDWGLAARLDKDGEIPPAGTPLYMAPETALEYLDHVNQQSTGSKGSSTRRIKAGTYSDVYLLGALLFKIVTGKAPHSGKTPFECLRNAARNRIVKVDRSSELLDIAYKAMATTPADRYRSVPEFVSALKSYQAHAQSIQIARRASEDLTDAEEQKSAPGVSSAATYAIYSSAQHGFQNALDLWAENRKAKEHLTKCKKSFSETAYSNGDYDLALSLLDGEGDADTELVSNIRRSQKQRQTRLAWFTTLRYATAASLLAALTFIAYSFKLGNDLFSAQADLDLATADLTRVSEEADEKIAQAEKVAEDKIDAGNREAAQKVAVAEKDAEATKQTAQREADRRIAEANEEVAAAKSQAESLAKEAQQQQYFATLGAIRSTLLESGEYAASKKMEAFDIRDVVGEDGQVPIEWANLQRQTDLSSEAQELNAIQLNQPRVAASPDGKWLTAVGGGEGDSQLLVFNTNDLEAPIYEAKLDSPASRAILSPNGNAVAVLSVEKTGGRLTVVDTKTGKTLRSSEDALATDSVTTVAFAPSGDEMLSGSGSTALVEWQIDAGAETIRRMASEDRVHGNPIVAVGYSPDGSHIFSADESGEIRVWKRNESDRWRPVWSYSHAEVASGKPQITAAICTRPAEGGLAIGYGCADGAVYLLRISDAAMEQRSSDPLAWSDATPEKMAIGHLGSVTDLSFAKHGTVLISSGYDTLQVHDLDRARLERPQGGSEIEPTRRYHDTTVLSCAAGSGDFAFSSDEAGRVVKWKIDVPPKTVAFDSASEGENPITALEVSPDDPPRIAVTDSAGFTQIWSADGERKLLDQLFIGHDDHRRMQAWYVSSSPGRIVTVAPTDESRAGGGGESGYRACLWNAESGLLEKSREIGPRSVLTISADGKSLIAATDRNDVDASAFDLSTLEGEPMWSNHPRISAMLSIKLTSESQPFTVVGLRDGQVYLWHPERGRIELERSSRRMHWRPIRGLAYDSTAKVLYAADSDGLVSRRQLGDASASVPVARHVNPNRTEPVTRLELSADGNLLLAMVNLGGSHELRLLDAKSLSPTSNQPGVLSDLVDATFSPAGDSILAVTEGSAICEWFVGESEWQRPKWAAEVKSNLRRGEPITGLRVDPQGNLLFYGPGFSQLWKGVPADPQLASVVRSRPRTHLVSFRSGNPDEVKALAGDGRLDDWTRTADRRFVPAEKTLPGLRDIVRACPASEEGQAFLALQDSTTGLTRIEKWDLNAGQLLRTVAEPFPGTCDVLAAKAGRVAYAARDAGKLSVTVVDTTGENPAERVELDTGIRATFVDLASTGDRLLVCTNVGGAFLVTREPSGEWKPVPFVRDDYSAAVFSPRGDRIILGSATGHVFIALPQLGEDQATARLLLSLPGHSERITVLKFSERDNKLALLSGDAAGRVLMHPLQ